MAGDPAGPDPPGQLPDVRVSSVHVREKAVQGRVSVKILMLNLCMGICVCFSARKKTGMVGHLGPDGRMLPLLPRGDPDKPRPPPRFSVVDMPKEDLHKQREIKEVDKKKEKEKENKNKAEEEKDEKDTKGGSEKKSIYTCVGKAFKPLNINNFLFIFPEDPLAAADDRREEYRDAAREDTGREEENQAPPLLDRREEEEIDDEERRQMEEEKRVVEEGRARLELEDERAEDIDDRRAMEADPGQIPPANDDNGKCFDASFSINDDF